MKKMIIMLVFCTSFIASNAMAHDFEWDTLLLAAIKLQPYFDYEANVDSYMRIYRPDVWNRYKNDEFELHDKREETIKMMKERVAAFSLDEEFIIHTRFEFGDYDFDKQVFPLQSISKNSQFYDTKSAYGSLPSRYKVSFSNPDKIGDINMPKDEARNFVKIRKNNYGTVDRRIRAKLEFRITKMKNDRDELEAELTKITIYADDKETKVLQEY